MKDLISVIVPIYNVEKLLPRCIESIANQTYKNLEIILVNDGSPDNSGKICDEYAKKDNRIKVIHKENGGLSDARNKGLDSALGNYIMFVDSDDYINPLMAEILYENLISNNADLSICNYKKVNNSDMHKVDKNSQVLNVYNKIECFNNLYNELYVRTEIACNKLYKKYLWNEIRYPFKKLHEDEYVIHHLIENCNKIVYSNLELYYYYDREDSITHVYNKKRLDAIDAFADRMKFFEEKKYSELYVKSAIAYLKVLGINYVKLNKFYKKDEEYSKIKEKFSIDLKKINNEIKIPLINKIQFFGMKNMPCIYYTLHKTFRK